jgi:RHS repeat-associated protein
VTNRYDAEGRRVEEVSRDGVVDYFGPLADWTPKSGLTKYIYAGSTLIARRRASERLWYMLDPHGSPRLLTRRSGHVASRRNYSPFGEIGQSKGGGAERIGFAGRRVVGRTGLVDMLARNYDPRLARMISADTVIPDPHLPAATNRYSYAYNSPLTYTDPSGHAPIFDYDSPTFRSPTLGDYFRARERLADAASKLQVNRAWSQSPARHELLPDGPGDPTPSPPPAVTPQPSSPSRNDPSLAASEPASVLASEPIRAASERPINTRTSDAGALHDQSVSEAGGRAVLTAPQSDAQVPAEEHPVETGHTSGDGPPLAPVGAVTLPSRDLAAAGYYDYHGPELRREDRSHEERQKAIGEFERMKQLAREYPGASLQRIRLEESAKQVNLFWKELSKFGLFGKGVRTQDAPPNSSIYMPQQYYAGPPNP